MKLACPQCGSRDAHVSHRTGAAEWLRSLIGIFPLRCRRCKTRWSTSTWESAAWKYARCPKCYRQQLSTWTREHYNPPNWILLQLRLGATPYRCVSCRCNFASFKRRKEKFSRQHEDRARTPPEIESDSAVEK
jgi:DNA-directed RNA polymerase subunit RPC12/RpoP